MMLSITTCNVCYMVCRLAPSFQRGSSPCSCHENKGERTSVQYSVKNQTHNIPLTRIHNRTTEAITWGIVK